MARVSLNGFNKEAWKVTQADGVNVTAVDSCGLGESSSQDAGMRGKQAGSAGVKPVRT